MNDLLDDDNATHARHERERELTLSTGAILSIFFGLVVLCGVCFGFGYKVGRSASPVPLAINDPAPATDPPSDLHTVAKHAAGSPLHPNSSGITTPATVGPDASAAPVVSSTVSKPAPVVRKPPPSTSGDPDSEPVTARSIEAAAATPPTPRAVSPSALLPGTSTTTGPGNIMVQVAAVSHQEDADLLVGALRSRGYSVSAHPAGADNFIHVQVGPFHDKKDAEAMRQRLLADGYNAMLKY